MYNYYHGQTGKIGLLSFSTAILVFVLAMGFISGTTYSLEHLYAQENSMEDGELPFEDFPPEPEAIPEEVPEDFPPEPEAIPEEVPEDFPPEPEAIPEEVPEDFPPEPEAIPEEVPEDFPPGENPKFVPPIVPEVEEIIKDPAGSVEDTLNTINENSPVSAPLIGGIVAVVAIGAGIASFSKHHHGRSSPSHSAQHQTQQDNTKEEQIYEDVQVITQGGIEV